MGLLAKLEEWDLIKKRPGAAGAAAPRLPPATRLGFGTLCLSVGPFTRAWPVGVA